MADGPAGQTDTRSRRWANGKLAFGRQTVMWGKLSGPIEATLTWNSADCPLGLILNGPGQRGYFARKDGASPLSLQFALTDEQFAKGVIRARTMARPRPPWS
jgi:hypothetical protein